MNDSKQNARRVLEEYRTNGGGSRETIERTQKPDGYDEMMDSLETMEQSIMQHIRTAGLKKNRECAIIDELLNLRKQRRQVFAKVVRDVHSLQEYSETVESALANERDSTRMRSAKIEESLRDKLEEQSLQVKRLKEQHNFHIDKLQERHKESLERELVRVKAKCESKLRVLEERVAEVQSGGAEVVREKVEAQLAEVRQEHSKSLLRYKEALRSLVAREKELKAESEDLARELRQSEGEKNHLADKLEVAVGQLSSAREGEDKARGLLDVASQKYSRLIERFRHEKQTHEDEMAACRSAGENELRSLQEQHTLELARVDEKVRAALTAKDEAIAVLRGEVREAAERGREAEELLESLNSDITQR